MYLFNKTETKTVYRYDGTVVTLDYTDRSPISGRWQIPGNCTEIAPPETKDGYTLSFVGSEWQYVAVKQEDDNTSNETTKTEPTTEEQLATLDNQYESDKKELQGYYIDALMMDDTETQEDLKTELAELTASYTADREALEA